MKPLPPLDEQVYKELVRKIEFLDSLIDMGEEPYEIEYYVRAYGDSAGSLFFGWLYQQGKDEAAEVLSQLITPFFEFVYLNSDIKRRDLRKLSGVSKPQLTFFINLVDFAVSNELWAQHVNPFDALLLFYQFIEEKGYKGNLPRKERALKELKRTIKKRPCSAPQEGFALMQ